MKHKPINLITQVLSCLLFTLPPASLNVYLQLR